MGDRYGDSLNLATTELYSADASRTRKVPATSSRRENEKARPGDRKTPVRWARDTGHPNAHTNFRNDRQVGSSYRLRV